MAEPEIDDTALEAARLAIENELIEWRDNRRFMSGNNGFVVKERDGTPSSIIRLNTAVGLRIGIKAYLAALPSGGAVLREHDEPMSDDLTPEEARNATELLDMLLTDGTQTYQASAELMRSALGPYWRVWPGIVVLAVDEATGDVTFRAANPPGEPTDAP